MYAHVGQSAVPRTRSPSKDPSSFQNSPRARTIRQSAPPFGAWFAVHAGADHELALAGRVGNAPSPLALTSAFDAWLSGAAAATLRDGIATIPVKGLLTRDFSWWNYTLGSSCYTQIAHDLDVALADSEVHTIMLLVDSPGGEVAGAWELAARIFAARGKKPLHAHVEGTAAAAAYWIAAAADRVSVSPTSMVGAIGISVQAVDWSEYDAKRGIRETTIVSSQSPQKALSPFEPDGRQQLQSHVDAIAAVMVNDVATYRGVTTEQVLRDFGAGDLAVGQLAVDAGLADQACLEAELRIALQTARAQRVLASRAATRKVAAPAATTRRQIVTPAPRSAAEEERALVAEIGSLVARHQPRRRL